MKMKQFKKKCFVNSLSKDNSFWEELAEIIPRINGSNYIENKKLCGKEALNKSSFRWEV